MQRCLSSEIEIDEIDTNILITWIAEDKRVIEEIKRLTGQKDEYILI